MTALIEVTRWNGATIRTVDIDGRLARLLKPETLAHVRRTAELARQLAEAHGVDPDQAELTALLHRVASVYNDRQIMALAEYYEIRSNPTETRVPRLLQGKVGAEILKNEWGIRDSELLDAVRHYISGAVRMAPLEKILFVADKLEPERDKVYGDLDPVRALAMTDLDAAVTRLSVWRRAELPAASWRVDGMFTSQNELSEFARATWPS